ncbi:TPA: DUF3630 family protein [Vibrio parahaemolyticus]|uniref:DUF3630 family protein n=1 Tax=Vibrio parahaemolyticus TaxID=670 RepID=UPI0005F183B2|nr:DUF3630 family protein [Vibrio parahaemolyticus]EGR0771515.1 DUF3630 family protein [Vibrio parahaemolyticus]EGR0841426.1 DUF3630 family protein [Vibrio parahaemolyticus]ELA9713965.1 DUF3630 family protein [Vibrio parahaemolyticus]ELA9727590.1 DUF3630 family protein [Vibrio parahaemolyticus]MBE5160100.1 DUF3630 family protein [Vibrio parahaemolyticus]
MQKEFGLTEYIAEEGRLLIAAPRFDLDTFPALGERLVGLLSAKVIEKQWDADIHSWLIDFEGCHLFMKAEHYSEAIWFEALNIEESREELDYLAGLFQRGF